MHAASSGALCKSACTNALSGIREYRNAVAAALDDDPVYVADDPIEDVSEAEADDLRRRIDRANAGPVFLAFLSEDQVAEAGGDEGAALREIVAPGSLSPDYVASEAIKRQKVDVLEIEYQAAATAEGSVPTRPVLSVVDELVAPLLRSTRACGIAVFVV